MRSGCCAWPAAARVAAWPTSRSARASKACSDSTCPRSRASWTSPITARGPTRISRPPSSSPSRPRLLLLLPTATYRATAFVEAARRLDIDLTVASEPWTSQAARPQALLTLPFRDRARTVDGALAFHRSHPLTAALGVDDDTAILAAAINSGLGQPTHPVEAAERARDKHLQREACA